MRFSLCPECLAQGYCQKLRARIVGDQELANRAFVADGRRFAFFRRVSSDHWHDFLCDAYRDYPGRIMQGNTEHLLNLEEFERPNIREWFRDFCCTPPISDEAIRLRPESKERVRVVLTILRALFPRDAQFWGLREKAANDNKKT